MGFRAFLWVFVTHPCLRSSQLAANVAERKVVGVDRVSRGVREAGMGLFNCRGWSGHW